MKLSLSMLTSIVILAGSIETGRAGEALDLVKSAAERAMATLKDPKLKSPDKKKERIERLKEVINPIFDYEGRNGSAHAGRALAPAHSGGAGRIRATIPGIFGADILG
jgi:ABC-type transporter MlaC component